MIIRIFKIWLTRRKAIKQLKIKESNENLKKELREFFKGELLK
jgi:hypothetical protein